MPNRLCPVARPVFGFAFPKGPAQGRPLSMNGQPTGIEVHIQQVANSSHELVVYDREENLLMCKFCAHVDSQLVWNTVLATVPASA